MLALCGVLAACSQPQETTVPKETLSPEQMLGKIRAQSEVGDEVVFQAMPDEVIVDLRQRAQSAEQSGEFAKARDLLDAALAINGNDPEVLQLRAELAIRQKTWSEAVVLAQKSYTSGAKLGHLCRRNWLTVHYAQLAQGQALPEQELARHLADCTVLPPARM